MIKVWRHASGAPESGGVVISYPISSLALRKGAACQIFPAATATVAGYAAAAATTPMLGITQHATTTASTKVDVMLTPNGTILECDVTEIANGTSMSLTGGATNTIADDSMDVPTGALVGAMFEVVTCASGGAKAGDKFTITANTTTTGAMSITPSASAVFASGDTIKWIKLGQNNEYAGTYLNEINTSYYDSLDMDKAGVSALRWGRVIGHSGDRKKLLVVVTNGVDNGSASS